MFCKSLQVRWSIGDALAGHSGVDGIVLTGGVPTGQAVMAKASENLTL